MTIPLDFYYTEHHSQPLTLASWSTLVTSSEPILIASTASIDELLTLAGGGIVMVTWKVSSTLAGLRWKVTRISVRNEDIITISPPFEHHV